MELDQFNDIYLNSLLDKISKENKSIFRLGDFNVDLLKYDHHAPTNEFLDSLSSHMFLPHIIQPTRVPSNSKTLIDNIFSNILMISHNPLEPLTHLQVVSQIFMSGIGLTLTKKILFLTI